MLQRQHPSRGDKIPKGCHIQGWLATEPVDFGRLCGHRCTYLPNIEIDYRVATKSALNIQAQNCQFNLIGLAVAFQRLGMQLLLSIQKLGKDFIAGRIYTLHYRSPESSASHVIAATRDL